ncbi:hypothetical protein GCM10009839_41990 [Catenulispora yoronensis]|uniref:Uncharacterized protein n=1 Tax=Catenulispora yoronensis TaxID=450799 RepID=A0ABP5FY97_9ACTN
MRALPRLFTLASVGLATLVGYATARQRRRTQRGDLAAIG